MSPGGILVDINNDSSVPPVSEVVSLPDKFSISVLLEAKSPLIGDETETISIF